MEWGDGRVGERGEGSGVESRVGEERGVESSG